MTRYLLMPFRPAPLILVSIFTIIGAYAIKGGSLGIPVDIILVSWFSKYCYVLLDAVVAGHDELPVLSVEMLNPVDEQRPLLQAVIVGLGFITCWWLYHSVGPVAGLGLGALLLGALPASVGLLAIGDNWWHALSPLAIARIIKGLGWKYLGVLAVTLGGGVAIVALALTLGSLLLIVALSQLVLLGMFCFVGGTIFESRVDLHLATRTRGEQLAERDDRQHVASRAAVLDRTYALLRLKRRGDAWANLEPWMRRHCTDSHPFTEYHALLKATCSWDDPVIGDQLANEYLGKLLESGETGLALDALQVRLTSNPNFYPVSEAYAKRLEQLATLGGRKVLSRQLLANAAARSNQ